MALLSEEEKQEIRDSLVEPGEEILSETATILRESSAADGYGQKTKSFTSVGTALCMVSKASLSDLAFTDRARGGGVGAEQLWKISFLDTVEILPTDRIQLAEREGDPVFECVSNPGLGTYTILNRVLWKEVTND